MESGQHPNRIMKFDLNDAPVDRSTDIQFVAAYIAKYACKSMHANLTFAMQKIWTHSIKIFVNYKTIPVNEFNPNIRSSCLQERSTTPWILNPEVIAEFCLCKLEYTLRCFVGQQMWP